MIKKLSVVMLCLVCTAFGVVKAQTVANELEKYVDPFSGDFNYNVPLATLTGPNGENYPFTLNYSAGIKVDQDASWVGLGWSCEPGEITRKVNGVPDDFKNSPIVTKTYYYTGSGDDLYTKSEGNAAGNRTATAFYYGPLYYADFPATAPTCSTSSTCSNNMDIVVDIEDGGKTTMLPAFDDFYVNTAAIRGTMQFRLFDIARVIPSKQSGEQSTFVYNEDEKFSATRRPQLMFNDEFIDANLPLTDLYSGHISEDMLPAGPINEGYYSALTDDDAYYLNSIGNEKYNSMSCYNSSQNRLKGKRFVKYFTNQELYAGMPAGFLEFRPVVSGAIRSSSSEHPGIDIGAIQITDEAGYTYHFSLPVYTDYETTNNFHLTGAYEFGTGSSGNSDSLVKTINNNKYAISWKLTAITGPDFKDENGNHFPDEGDKGYWIRFDYNRWGAINDRFPAYGLSYNASHVDESEGCIYCRTDFQSFVSTVSNYNQGFYSEKRQEVYYLERAQTETQSTYFFKEIRKDVTKSKSSEGTEKFPLLRLKSVALIENKHNPENLITQDKSSVELYGTNDDDVNLTGNNTLHVTLPPTLFSVQAGPSFYDKTLSSVTLDYDYSLCKKYFGNINCVTYTPNGVTGFCKVLSEDYKYITANPSVVYVNNTTLPESGKLTLKSVQHYDLRKNQSKGPVTFSYYGTDVNYPYSVCARDFWGNYKSDYTHYITAGKENPAARFTTRASSENVHVWSLHKIELPSKAEIEVNYESDVYYQAKGGKIPMAVKTTTGTGFSYNSKVYEDDVTYLNSSTGIGVGIVNEFDHSQQKVFESGGPNQQGLTVFQNTDAGLTIGVDSMFGGGLRVEKISIKETDKLESYGLNFYYQNGMATNTPYKYEVKSNYVSNPNWNALNSNGVAEGDQGVFFSYIVPKTSFNTGLNAFVNPMIGYEKVRVVVNGNGETGRVGYKELLFDNTSPLYYAYDHVIGTHKRIVEGNISNTQCIPDYYPAYINKLTTANLLDKFGKLNSVKLYDNKNNIINTVKYFYKTRKIYDIVSLVNSTPVERSHKYFYTFVNVIIPLNMDINFPIATSGNTDVPNSIDLMYNNLISAANHLDNIINSIDNSSTSVPVSTQNKYKDELESARYAIDACRQLDMSGVCSPFGALSTISTAIGTATSYSYSTSATSIKTALSSIRSSIYTVVNDCDLVDLKQLTTSVTSNNNSASNFTPLNISGYMIVPQCGYSEGNGNTVLATYLVMNREVSKLDAVYTIENGVVQVDSTVYDALGMVSASITRSGDYSSIQQVTYAFQEGSSHQELGPKTVDEDNKNLLVFKSQINAKPGYLQTVSYGSEIKKRNWSDGFSTIQENLWTPLETFHQGNLKGGISLYSHRNKPVESYDPLRRFNSQKYGYNDKYILASASNSLYSEFTHSSFEDDLYTGSTKKAVGGEVYITNAGTIIDASSVTLSGSVLSAHSGKKILKIENGNAGLSFEGQIEPDYSPSLSLNTSDKFIENKKYVAYVWCHQLSAGAIDIKVYAKPHSGGTENIVAEGATVIFSSPTWKLLKLDFIAPENSQLMDISVKVMSVSGGDVYVDDFRVQPISGTVTAYVYDDFSGQVTYTLNENNMYSRNEYDNSGRLVKQYIETKLGEKLLKEYKYNVPF